MARRTKPAIVKAPEVEAIAKPVKAPQPKASVRQVKTPEPDVIVVPEVKLIKAPQPKATPKRTQVFIANPTMGDIVYPKPSKAGLKATNIIFPAGRSTPVDAEEWNEMKKKTGMKNYLDNGMLAMVNRVGDVLIVRDSGSELPIPEHLKRDEEIVGKTTDVKASVRKKDVIQVEV